MFRSLYTAVLIFAFSAGFLAAETTAAAEENFVTLYRQGNPNTVYSSSKPVSTSPSPDLRHYDPSAQLLEFKVPQQTFDQWRLQNLVQTFSDLHAPSGIITPETNAKCAMVK